MDVKMNKKNEQRQSLPVDIVLAPDWWNKHAEICFDEDYFYHPLKRVETEQKQEKVLYDRWGRFGLGSKEPEAKPVIGAVHLAAGFLLQEMVGCEVKYIEDGPPTVAQAKNDELSINVEKAFESEAFKRFEKMTQSLRKTYGYLTGDVNWSGVLNMALDIRGENIFMDMFDKPEKVLRLFGEIGILLDKFTELVSKRTSTTSISVNRVIDRFEPDVFLHSECSHTMISEDDYRKFLMPIDIEWSKKVKCFGIHHCGTDADRFAECYAEIPKLAFLDVGWGSDVKKLREHLPNTFLNIRLSPVEILEQSEQQIHNTICRLVEESGNLKLTGLCCINMDGNVSDEKISTIFETANELRENKEKKE